MQENECWALLEKLNWDEAGDDEAVIKPVVDALSQKNISEIYEFEDFIAQKLYALDTKAHAKEIGEEAYINDEEFFSVDGFLYSRCVVVANGEGLFNQVMANPSEFPKDMEFEALLGIAQEAYEKKTGSEWEHSSSVDYETFSNKQGWA